MSSLSKFKTDKDLEKSGVWFDFGDCKVKCARAGGSNSKYHQALTTAMKPYYRQIQANTLSADTRNRLVYDVFARTVVLDWELTEDDENGAEKPVPCNYENIVRIFNDYPDFFEMVSDQATSHANYAQSLLEDISKN